MNELYLLLSIKFQVSTYKIFIWTGLIFISAGGVRDTISYTVMELNPGVRTTSQLDGLGAKGLVLPKVGLWMLNNG